MKSVVAKRSIVIHKHKTSVSLEDQFWLSLKSIAAHKHLTLSELVSDIDGHRQHGNLSSALRLFVLGWYRGPVEDATMAPAHHEAGSLVGA
jgi:predicted DNA-binding ribbon-helix-helix protein